MRTCARIYLASHECVGTASIVIITLMKTMITRTTARHKQRGVVSLSRSWFDRLLR